MLTPRCLSLSLLALLLVVAATARAQDAAEADSEAPDVEAPDDEAPEDEAPDDEAPDDEAPMLRAWAVVDLQDGTRFEGPLLGMSPEGIVLQVDGIAVTLARGVVASMSLEQRPGPELAPAVPGDAAWILVRLHDGSVVSGTLVRQTADAIALETAEGPVEIARRDVESTAVGTLGGVEAEVPSVTTDAPAETLAPAANPAVWEEYRQRRLLMLDHKARLIGPPHLGYAWDAFNRRRNGRFHFVFGKKMRTRIRTGELQDLVDDPAYNAVMAEAVRRAKAERKAGWAFVAGGAGAMVTAVVMNSIGAADSDLSPVLFGGIPLLASGITFFVVGGSLDVKSRKRLARIRGFDFSELLPRDKGWALMQRHNAALRTELGLEDDEALDGLEDAAD